MNVGWREVILGRNGTITLRFDDRAAEHNATLPFTRNVVGPMDYTPGTFSDSQHPHITSYGHELALPIIFESALAAYARQAFGLL